MSRVPLPPSDNPYFAPSSGPGEVAVRSFELKRIGVLSAGKILGVIYVLVGLVIGGIMALAALVQIGVEGGNAAMAVGYSAGTIVFAPIFYGAIGFVVGIVMSALYNLLASLMGGVKLEFN